MAFPSRARLDKRCLSSHNSSTDQYIFWNHIWSTHIGKEKRIIKIKPGCFTQCSYGTEGHIDTTLDSILQSCSFCTKGSLPKDTSNSFVEQKLPTLTTINS